MNSLVANYGTSSSESEADKSEDEGLLEESKNESLVLKLPKPDFDGSSSKNSVFSNPFVEAENAKKAILEKHVKMVPTKGKVEMINGKKICWNYRKGRCHFGHNCTFAHDTDLQRTQGEQDGDQTQLTLDDNNTSRPRITQVSGSNQVEEAPPEDPDDKWENQNPARKKRPGLTPGLIPSKKAKKFFKKTNNSTML